MSRILIGESGGTKTDWCLIGSEGTLEEFTTESYHNDNWNPSFHQRSESFWKEKPKLLQANLLFFGAGCFNLDIRKKQAQLFTKLGFKNVEIKSDLDAAGIAAYGIDSGLVSINGTGSVLFEWSGHEVSNLHGGLGFEMGDEGSGYYFGWDR